MDKEFSKPAYLCSKGYGVETDMLIGVLERQGIPVMCKHRGAGQYLTLVYGFSYQPVDIFVPSTMLEKARSILSDLPGITNENHFWAASLADEDDDFRQLKRRSVRKRMIIGWFFLASAVLPMLFMLIDGLISLLTGDNSAVGQYP